MQHPALVAAAGKSAEISGPKDGGGRHKYPATKEAKIIRLRDEIIRKEMWYDLLVLRKERGMVAPRDPRRS